MYGRVIVPYATFLLLILGMHYSSGLPAVSSCWTFAIALTLVAIVLFWVLRDYAREHKRIVLRSIVADDSVRERLLRTNVIVNLASGFFALALTVSFGVFMLSPELSTVLFVAIGAMCVLLIHRAAAWIVALFATEGSGRLVSHILSSVVGIIVLSGAWMALTYYFVSTWTGFEQPTAVDFVIDEVKHCCLWLQHVSRTFYYFHVAFMASMTDLQISDMFITAVSVMFKSFLPITAVVLLTRGVDDLAGQAIQSICKHDGSSSREGD